MHNEKSDELVSLINLFKYLSIDEYLSTMRRKLSPLPTDMC